MCLYGYNIVFLKFVFNFYYAISEHIILSNGKNDIIFGSDLDEDSDNITYGPDTNY